MAQRGRPKAELVLSEEERDTLARWARRPNSPQSLALRSKIVLACAAGKTNRQVAAELHCNKVTVGKWRQRFVDKRLKGLADEYRPGVPRSITDDHVEAVVVKTLTEKPTDATHWSTRSLARATGMSQPTIARIWKAFGLKPWLEDTFKLSEDPLFIDKVRDVVGLYLNPPERAVVLCVDEKTQVQALDRTQPIFPMLPGVPERRSHDYVRHGTIDLYAALDLASGAVLHQLTKRHPGHRVQEILGSHRQQRSTRARRPRRRGQLLHPQDPGHLSLAACPPPLRASLHTDLVLVDESRRAVVRRAHHQMAASWRPPQRPRARPIDHRVGGHLERGSPPLCVAQDRR